MKAHRILLSLLGLGLVLAGVGCGGSSQAAPAAAQPKPYATTVLSMIKDKTLETNQPDALATLNLAGAETEDPHAFDSVLTGH